MLQHLTAQNSRDAGSGANKRSYLAELSPPLIIKPASYPQVQQRQACLAACWGKVRGWVTFLSMLYVVQLFFIYFLKQLEEA